MPYEIGFMGAQHRVRDGQVSDVIDYLFQVSNGESQRHVAIGITGQSYDPPKGMGPRLTGEELRAAVEAWLRFHLNKGYDPFNQPDVRIPDLPGSVVQYWAEHHEIPHWL